MPASIAKNLSSICRSTSKATSLVSKARSPSSAAADQSSDLTPKHLLSLDTSNPSTTLKKFRKGSPRLEKTSSKSRTEPSCGTVIFQSSFRCDDTEDLTQEISTVLDDGTLSYTASLPGSPLEKVIKVSPNLSMPLRSVILRRKEQSRDKKQMYAFKESQIRRFDRLGNMYAGKFGESFTLVYDKLGFRERGIKGYNVLIGLCIKKSRTAEHEEVILEQISKAYQLLKSMREEGLQLEEETYGQFLTFLIDTEMVEEFKLFSEVIQQENPNSLPRLAYYEMLLWIRLDSEDNIKELCDYIATNDDADSFSIRENYLLALCESERIRELLMLLDIIDITKISSMGQLRTIFKSLARLLLEPFAKKFISALKNCDIGAEIISKLIYDYAITVPNLAVQDAVLKFKSLHEELGVMPSPASYEELIKHCCNLLKVHTALDIIDHMCDAGLTLSPKAFDLILQACGESCDFNLVHRIYSLICQNNLKTNNEIFRKMIYLRLRLNDFNGAYTIIGDMEKMGIKATSHVYNVIMAAHFREKNIQGGLRVLSSMKRANVKPDSWTFSCLIQNCENEEDIIKYHKEAKRSGVCRTKHIFIALIHAYASFGKLEKAKQVILRKGIPEEEKNEIKSVLVSVLACRGKLSDALTIYEDIKQSKGHAEPKTILCLIDHLQGKENLSRLLNLLIELNGTKYWTDGCYKVILYCVKSKDLRSTVDLLKQLSDKFYDDDIATEVLFDEAFCKIAMMKHVDLQFGMDLLHSIQKELGIRPSRKSLDFLLCACTSAKDSKTAHLIWKEYEAAGVPYNALTYLRMYQTLLACGKLKSAKELQKKIPTHDPHVVYVIKTCQKVYIRPKKKKITSDDYF